jgi:glyoxylase-like metal-dependent hydrolase (beta-lactamase superfamily II)
MEIVPGIHEINYGFVQSYLIEDADRLTLIDTGIAGQAQAVIDEITRLGRAPSDLREIVLTHAHVDHTGSAAELVSRTGAQVLAHRLDVPVVRGDQEICPPILSELERPYAEQAMSRVDPAAPCHVDRVLDEGNELDVDGGGTVLHVPGHTPSSIAILTRKRRALFCGDAVASLNERPIVGFFNCDPALARRSFERLAELDFDIACFGHGTALGQDAASSFRRLAERLARADQPPR